jgi:hypothetical protein
VVGKSVRRSGDVERIVDVVHAALEGNGEQSAQETEEVGKIGATREELNGVGVTV